MSDELWQRAQQIERRNAARAAAEKALKDAGEAKRLEEEAERLEAESLEQQRFARIEPSIRSQLIEMGSFAAQYFSSRGVPPTEFRNARMTMTEGRWGALNPGPVVHDRVPRGSGWYINSAHYLSSDGSWWHMDKDRANVNWHCLSVDAIIKSLATNSGTTDLIKGSWVLRAVITDNAALEVPLQIWSPGFHPAPPSSLGTYQDVVVERIVGGRGAPTPRE